MISIVRLLLGSLPELDHALEIISEIVAGPLPRLTSPADVAHFHAVKKPRRSSRRANDPLKTAASTNESRAIPLKLIPIPQRNEISTINKGAAYAYSG
jgi:hypothetical protein